MKFPLVFGLLMGAGLYLTAHTANADDAQPASTQAMQMQLDKTTGQKLSADDDSGTAVAASTTQSIVDAKGHMPITTEEPQHHSDGSISIKLGTEQLKYLVMTVDDSGEKTLSHQTGDALDLKAPVTDKGEK